MRVKLAMAAAVLLPLVAFVLSVCTKSDVSQYPMEKMNPDPKKM